MPSFRVIASAIVAAALSSVFVPAAGAAPSATEYTGMAAGGGPNDLVLGGDGNVWFTESGNPGAVGRITPWGSIVEYSGAAGLSKDGAPNRIANGPGGVWATLTGKGKIARVTSVGGVSEFTISGKDKPIGIAEGPDGNLWFTAQGGTNYIGQITPSGSIRQFTAGLSAGSQPGEVVAGPDGNLWFVEGAAPRIGRVTMQGAIKEFPTGSLGSMPRDLTLGPDGNLWFTESGATPAIGRMTRTGVVDRFPIAAPNSAPLAITTGGDGNLYFTDPGAGMVGQVTTAGAITPYFSTGSTVDLRDIVTGSDGALWLAAYDRDSIGRLTVAPLSGAVTASAVGESSALMSGVLKPNAEATTAWFEWGPTTAYGQSTPPQSVSMSGAQKRVSASLAGLAPSTTYHVRLVASNATGVSYGPDRTFSTTAADAPSATTDAASGVGPTEALLNAVVNPHAHATTAHFEWGTTPDYGDSSVETTVGADAGDHSVSEQVTGLEPNRTYHFRVVATSDVAVTAGADEVFTTEAVPPDTATDAATDLTGTTAKLAGRINPRNSATTYRFEWGTTADLGNTTALGDLAEVDNQPHAISATLTDLEPNTTYYFRLVASGEAGTSYGPVETFRTAVAVPLAVTGDPAGVSSTDATLTATVDPRNAPVSYWFEWGTSVAYGNATPTNDLAPVLGTAGHLVEARILGLAAGATYHYRIVARSAAGTTYGEDRQFSAATVPSPGTPPLDRPGARPTPTFGRAVAASVVSGQVRVRVPGHAAVEIDGATTLPNGSLVDAREGTLKVVSALDAAGHTQHATFRGARFRIAQPRSGGGVVNLDLRERPSGCRTSAVLARTSRKGKKTPSLWAKDRHGKYRTRGRNSVATVRGTVWITTETCAGTRTTVKRGKVAVAPRGGGRRVMVRAGQSFLARPAG